MNVLGVFFIALHFHLWRFAGFLSFTLDDLGLGSFLLVAVHDGLICTNFSSGRLKLGALPDPAPQCSLLPTGCW